MRWLTISLVSVYFRSIIFVDGLHFVKSHKPVFLGDSIGKRLQQQSNHIKHREIGWWCDGGERDIPTKPSSG
jgi:hypothetical protein